MSKIGAPWFKWITCVCWTWLYSGWCQEQALMPVCRDTVIIEHLGKIHEGNVSCLDNIPNVGISVPFKFTWKKRNDMHIPNPSLGRCWATNSKQRSINKRSYTEDSNATDALLHQKKKRKVWCFEHETSQLSFVCNKASVAFESSVCERFFILLCPSNTQTSYFPLHILLQYIPVPNRYILQSEIPWASLYLVSSPSFRDFSGT